MRKAEFKKQAERTEDGFAFYRAMQCRWADGQMANPITFDITYHLTEEAAMEAANSLNLELGFEAQVERITVDYDCFNAGIKFQEEFELKKLADRRAFYADSETIFESEANEGRKLDPDAIVVMYRHHMYMNYAYRIEAVKFVWETDLKTEADCRNDADSTTATYYLVIEDIDKLAEFFGDPFMTYRPAPFNKLNSGATIVREFLAENGHPDYVETVEDIEE